MSTSWQSFVARAIHGEPDEPFLRLLRQRINHGYEVVRVNLVHGTSGLAYVVLLSHLRQLSKMEVPHSASFTRWSLANGIRMASIEEEEERWAVIVGEGFQQISDDFGADHASLILVDRLRALGPPRTMNILAGLKFARAAPGHVQAAAIRSIDALFGSLAADLGGALRYSPEEVADILDGALVHFWRARWSPARLAVLAARGGRRG